MFGKVSERTVSAMIRHGMADESRKTVYVWGLSYILNTIFNISLFALTGIITGMLAETVLFTAAYIALRIYAGGFHASTPQRCCVFSLLLLSGALVMVSYAAKIGMIIYVLTALSVLTITFMSPVGSENKPLSSAECEKYRRKALLILLAEEMSAAALHYLNINRYFYVLSAVWTALAIMLVLGRLKNSEEKRQLNPIRKEG